jgi:hypothetical protein
MVNPNTAWINERGTWLFYLGMLLLTRYSVFIFGIKTDAAWTSVLIGHSIVTVRPSIRAGTGHTVIVKPVLYDSLHSSCDRCPYVPSHTRDSPRSSAPLPRLSLLLLTILLTPINRVGSSIGSGALC